MSLAGLASVVHRLMGMAAGGMGMVGSFFVLPAFVLFSCFSVMARGVGMMLGGLFVMFGCLLGHEYFLFDVGILSPQKGNSHLREAFLRCRLWPILKHVEREHHRGDEHPPEFAANCCRIKKKQPARA